MAPHYSVNDLTMLIDLIEEHYKILENKETQSDLELQANQKKCWQAVTDRFNQQTQHQRTVSQLQAKWDMLKKNAKKAQTKQRKEQTLTGGGVPSTDIDIEPHLLRVLALMSEQLTLVYSEFDSNRAQNVLCSATTPKTPRVTSTPTHYRAVVEEDDVNLILMLEYEEKKKTFKEVKHEYKALKKQLREELRVLEDIIC